MTNTNTTIPSKKPGPVVPATTDHSDEHTSLLAKPKKLITHSPWLYPFRGIGYYATHSFLWPLLRARLLPAIFLALLIYPGLIFWLYLPQVAFLAIWQGRHAWFNAAILILLEGAAIVQLLFEAFFVDETLVNIFDSVLVEAGFESLVEHRREVLPPRSVDGLTLLSPPARLGVQYKSAVYNPFALHVMVKFVVYIPLTFIPYAGGVLYLILCAHAAGPYHHWRYFKLSGVHKHEREALMKKEWYRYTAFGTTALILQLVPGLSMLFLMTTAAGAAVWVVDLEHDKKLVEAARLTDAVVESV